MGTLMVVVVRQENDGGFGSSPAQRIQKLQDAAGQRTIRVVALLWNRLKLRRIYCSLRKSQSMSDTSEIVPSLWNVRM